MSERFEDRFRDDPEILRRTPWTLIGAAQRGDSGAFEKAVERIYAMFQGAVHGFLRARGLSAEEARDLAQEFFATLLERKFLDRLDPAKGRLRPFLFASLKRFLCDAVDKRDAQKRRPAAKLLSLDGLEGPGEPSSGPDRQFARMWAAEVLRRGLERMRRRCEGTPQEAWYRALILWHAVGAEAPASGHADLGARLGASAQQAANYLFRGRALLRELLLEELSGYCATGDELQAEISELFEALGRAS
ncbi:MAG TPA: sigma factor [Planctomycetota bacterium]|nr:sigma factor [Planctomycetota bacterium]